MVAQQTMRRDLCAAGEDHTWIDREVDGDAFEDVRLGQRLRRLLARLACAPGHSLCLVCQDWANAAYDIAAIGQLCRDRCDCENGFDELKNRWGWGGFTTQDLKRCRLLAASVALIYNWWSLFVRLADPDQHREVITSRPLLLQAIARKTQHAGRTTLSVSSTHGEQQTARRAYLRIARFFARLREKAEQLDAVQRWYRILSEALRKYLRGRQLIPPARLQPG